MRDRRWNVLLAQINHHYPVIRDRAELATVPQLLHRRQGEFCVSPDLSPNFVAAVCQHGYLPMGERVYDLPLLLIKSHNQRCIVDWDNLHISRKVRRYARDLTFHINRDFATCLAQIVAHHHPSRWLIEPLCQAFTSLHHQPHSQVACHSIEVYAQGKLVAGEIGYSTGRIYTSLAAFHIKNGAGSVQLALLGNVLSASGFAFWDLGMPLPYKTRLGAHIADRKAFLERWTQYADQRTPNWSTTYLSPADNIALLACKPHG